MKKAILGGVLGLALAIAGYFGYTKYQQQQYLEAIAPHVKNTSIRVENAAKLLTDSPGSMTYKELFAKMEADVAEIDKRVIEVQSLTTSRSQAVGDAAVEYMQASQEFLRHITARYQAKLTYSNKIDWAEKSIQRIRSASYYESDYVRKAANDAITEATKAGEEQIAAMRRLAAKASALVEVREKAAVMLPGDMLVPASALSAVAEAIDPKEERGDASPPAAAASTPSKP